MAKDRIAPRKVCRGNLRPAPLAISPSIVRRVLALSEASADRVVQVPIEPIVLVDRPVPSPDATESTALWPVDPQMAADREGRNVARIDFTVRPRAPRCPIPRGQAEQPLVFPSRAQRTSRAPVLLDSAAAPERLDGGERPTEDAGAPITCEREAAVPVPVASIPGVTSPPPPRDAEGAARPPAGPVEAAPLSPRAGPANPRADEIPVAPIVAVPAAPADPNIGSAEYARRRQSGLRTITRRLEAGGKPRNQLEHQMLRAMERQKADADRLGSALGRAIAFLQRTVPVYRCEVAGGPKGKYQVGRREPMTAADVIALAEAKGWVEVFDFARPEAGS